MTIPVVERRRAEQRARIEAVAAWTRHFAAEREVTAVVVFGSTVRGDFNKWSDTDVLVVAEELPEGWRSRMELLAADIPPGIQPVGWTPAELAERRRRGDPIARECDSVGVVVHGALPPAASVDSRIEEADMAEGHEQHNQWESHRHEAAVHSHLHYHVTHNHNRIAGGFDHLSSEHEHSHDHAELEHSHHPHEDFDREHRSEAHDHDHQVPVKEAGPDKKAPAAKKATTAKKASAAKK